MNKYCQNPKFEEFILDTFELFEIPDDTLDTDIFLPLNVRLATKVKRLDFTNYFQSIEVRKRPISKYLPKYIILPRIGYIIKLLADTNGVPTGIFEVIDRDYDNSHTARYARLSCRKFDSDEIYTLDMNNLPLDNIRVCVNTSCKIKAIISLISKHVHIDPIMSILFSKRNEQGDIRIISENGELKAHTMILIATSDMFERQLSKTSLFATDNSEIILEGVVINEALAFLHLLYFGNLLQYQIELITLELLDKLLDLINYYQCKECLNLDKYVLTIKTNCFPVKDV